ncbi:MAG: MFS transporter [Pirellulales bacterium]|nr:MFS transporter [Pirellulales bacterium]
MHSGPVVSGSKHLAPVPRERSLVSKSFLGLLLTQFLGATNDNILRWLVIGIGKDYVEPSRVGWVLTLGTAMFVLPYLLLAAPSGYLADRFSKRRVIVACKMAEIVIMTLAVIGIWTGQMWFILLVLGLIGSQAALFGPSKLGSIPEMLDASRISAANGLIGLTTVFSTTVGSVVGSVLADFTRPKGQEHLEITAMVLIGVAVAGWLSSLAIERLPAANPTRRYAMGEPRRRPLSTDAAYTDLLAFVVRRSMELLSDTARQTWRDLKILSVDGAMLRVALGIFFFWTLGGLAHLNIDQFAAEAEATKQSQMAPLLVSLVVGIGVGSVLAGVWSQGRVELGILPLGALGLSLTAMLLFTVEGEFFEPSGEWTISYVAASGLLFLLGCSGGLFDVPLAAYMQHYSPREHRGSILAASNFLTFGGILIASLAFGLMRLPVGAGSLQNALAQYQQPEQQALARQLWNEMQSLRRQRAFINAHHYVEMYPENGPVVHEVYREVVGHPLLSARMIFLLCGVLTVPVLVYIVILIPQATIRFMAWLLTHTFYKVRVFGRGNLPEEGPALLAPNHVTWLDGLLLVAVSPRPVRLIITESIINNRWTRGLARIMGVIPIRSGPKAVRSAIDAARDALNHGELVCIFPEGRISSSGQLQNFKPGVLEIIKGADAGVIPVYLDELWGSIFTLRGGRLFWRWPTLSPRAVSIWFGPELERPQTVYEIRNAVQVLAAEAVSQRKQRAMVLPRLMIRKCRKAMFRWKIADSTDQSLTGGQLLMRSLILRRLLRREVLAKSAAEEKYIGILLPPSNGAVVVNAAVTLAGRVACNLNYTVSADVMNKCIRKAGIKHVLTSKRVIDRLDMKLDAKLVLLEDFAPRIARSDKIAGVLQAFATPAPLLDRMLGLHRLRGDDELTVIFTSGSTGEPKGVVLTFHNLGTNVEAVEHAIKLTRDDILLGVVPFFHSLGYMVTLWCVLGLDIHCVYHYSPLDAQQVGRLARKWGASILIGTATFFRNYLRRCEPEDFAELEVAVAGAEKLPIPLCDAFEEKFGVRPIEGYGTTELSPLVSVNIPPSRSQTGEIGAKEGSVGRPIAGVAARIVDPETWDELPIETPGMLLIKGPNVMKGYLHEPEKTAQVVRDGWYTTGDIAKLDKHGFIEITGRLSRFSKIGGEMVPHLNVEEAIQQLVQGGSQEELIAVVTSVPCEKKGERLVVVHTGKMTHTPQQVVAYLRSLKLPNLWIPDADSFLEVDEIPVLGTGKLDIKGLSDVAKQRFAAYA